MTVKESLREVIDEMTDAEAAALLGYVEQARAAAHPHGGDVDKLLELMHKWAAEDAELDDDTGEKLQWALRESGGVRFREMHEW